MIHSSCNCPRHCFLHLLLPPLPPWPESARWRTTLVSLHPLLQIQLQYPLSTETTGKLTAEKRPVKQTPPKPSSPFQPCSCPGVAVDGEKCNFANIEGHFEKSV